MVSVCGVLPSNMHTAFTSSASSFLQEKKMADMQKNKIHKTATEFFILKTNEFKDKIFLLFTIECE